MPDVSDNTVLKLTAPEEDGRGTTGWLAGKLDITEQSVRNWHAAGMPSCGVDPRRGGPMFDLAECRKWALANRPARLHGGARRGAGRPRNPSPAEMVGELSRAETKAEKTARAEALMGELGRAAAEEAASPRVDLDHGLLKLTEAELKILAVLDPATSGLTPAAMSRLQDLAKVRKMEMEAAERRGALHDAGACEAAQAGHLTLLRTKLMGMPGRAAAQVVAAAKLGPELVPVVKAALVAAVDEVMREIAADPMGIAA